MTLPAHYLAPNPLTTPPSSAVSYADIRRDTARYPRLQAVPREVGQQALEQIVFRAFFNNAGTQLRDEDAVQRIALIAAELYDMLLEDYEEIGTKHLSFAELARVIRMASVSARREMYGVSVAGLYRAVADYCLGEGQKASRIVKAERWAKMQQRLPENSEELNKEAARLAAKMNINKTK